MTKAEKIQFINNQIATLQKFSEAFWHLSPQELGPPTNEPDPDRETIARLLDAYGLDGSLFRNITKSPESNPLSLQAFNKLEEQIKTLYRLIAAIEEKTETVTIPDDCELLSVKQAALFLGWGESTVRQRDGEGLLPMPIRFGGTVQWSRVELQSWINAGCPPRQKWENMKHVKEVV